MIKLNFLLIFVIIIVNFIFIIKRKHLLSMFFILEITYSGAQFGNIHVTKLSRVH